MRIKLLTIVAGPEYSGHPGDTLDLPDAVARGLVSGGYAVPVLARVETATAEPKAEQSVTRKGKG